MALSGRSQREVAVLGVLTTLHSTTPVCRVLGWGKIQSNMAAIRGTPILIPTNGFSKMTSRRMRWLLPGLFTNWPCAIHSCRDSRRRICRRNLRNRQQRNLRRLLGVQTQHQSDPSRLQEKMGEVASNDLGCEI